MSGSAVARAQPNGAAPYLSIKYEKSSENVLPSSRRASGRFRWVNPAVEVTQFSFTSLPYRHRGRRFTVLLFQFFDQHICGIAVLKIEWRAGGGED